MTIGAAAATRPRRPPPWNDPRIRGIFYQILFVAVIAAFGAFLIHNTLVNLRRQNIASGFGFLDREAAFGIGESLIAYSPADSYARAFLVGLVNTVYVSALGIVLATVLGTVMGIARLSSNWLIRKLAQVYVETFRNIPLLLQLFFWWALLRESAPAPRQAWEPLSGVFISNRGIGFPVPIADPVHPWMLLALVIGIVLAFVGGRWSKRRQALTGEQFPAGWVGAGLVLGLPIVVFLAAVAPTPGHGFRVAMLSPRSRARSHQRRWARRTHRGSVARCSLRARYR